MTQAKRICLTLLTLLFLLSACAPTGTNTPSEPFAVLRDKLGRELTLTAQPRSIVTLTPANTEIVCALGLIDRLAAVDDFSSYPEEVNSLPRIGAYAEPNIEAIVALKPDLVLAGDALQLEAIDQLTELGIPTLATEVTTFADVPSSISLVAEALGAREEANALLSEWERRTEAVEKKVNAIADVDRPKVYWAVSFGEWGDYTAGPGSFPDDIIRMAGGINVSGNSEYAWPMYTVEQIVLDDPDVIVIPGDESMREAFVTADAYSSLRAVKEGRVYCMDGDIVSRPGPRLTEAAEILFALLYPEA